MAGAVSAQAGVSQNVDVFIGTGGHGHTSPFALVPFGMVQVGPDTGNEGWDWCSGYHYSDSSIVGFSHSHLSGTGCGDLGDILFMPAVGPVQIVEGSKKDPDSGYRARFSHKDEQAKPGYYSVYLSDQQVKVELTATARAGFHQYHFPKKAGAHVIIDLVHGLGSDQNVESGITLESPTLVTGWRRSKGWAKDQIVYFAARFSQPITQTELFKNDQPAGTKNKLVTEKTKAALHFDTTSQSLLQIKVGISAVDTAGALNNADTEIPDWNFEQVKRTAAKAWETELSRVEVSGGTAAERTTFYTALYHTMIFPCMYGDADGRYRGADGQVHQAKGFVNHTVFSLWDTYRAAHPLFTLIQQKRTADFVETMMAFYREYGLLPVWSLAANETDCMIGYHSIPVLADAYFKGLAPKANWEEVFTAMKHSAMQDKNGLKHLKEMGYIPGDKEPFSISKMQEYAIDDWCIAQMAKALGKTADYEYFSKRAVSYRNVWNPQTGFFQPKNADGSWKGSGNGPFDPKYSDHLKGDYIEGNAWQYLWLVPHNVEDLISLIGGNEKFEQRLTQFYNEDSKVTGENASMDISGLIGQCAHGNEPSHHIAYLYNFAGYPHKTQALVRRIMREMYNATPEGLCGNEDCGQMSAWYVLSAMGLYPVNPADGRFHFGSPLFSEIKLHLENGKTFTLQARKNSAKNQYVQSVSLNGKPYKELFVDFRNILQGGKLEFRMGATPVKP